MSNNSIYSMLFGNKDENETKIKEAAHELINFLIFENGGIINHTDEKVKDLAQWLNVCMLRGIKNSHDSSEWTAYKKNSAEIAGNDGKIYKFSAFSGYKSGGSERWEEEELTMICGDDPQIYKLYSSGYYMR